MKKFYLLLALCFCVSHLIGQNIKMVTSYSSPNKEISDLLQFENIDYYGVNFIGEDISTQDYILIAKEMWNGKLKTVDTLVNTAKYTMRPNEKSDTLKLKVLAKKTFEPKLKLSFKFPGMVLTRKFDAIQSDNYSLRDIGVKEQISFNENFYAFAYILPYEKDGMLFWCAVDDSGKDVESWGSEFGIEHYIIFEMKFLKD
ncbi:hypothetical protein [Dokdonia sp. Asnod2-E02]|uniref:hypothetical protein n=1 Tax=Dokdonia sp. Asnod2-E02 TaxID=3160574 RepID=UPI00386A9B03